MDCSTPFRYLSISRKLPISVEITRKSGNFPVIGNTAQVSSESTFSIAGNIVTHSRSRLITEHVEELCFLHANLKI